MWAISQARAATQHKRTVKQTKLNQPKSAQGVGQGTSVANYQVELPLGCEDVEGNAFEMSFTAPCVENSSIPGLLGIDSLERYDALIRCSTGELWFLGSGGVEIKASPGSRQFQMRKARSGHWMLPVSRFSPTATPTKITLQTSLPDEIEEKRSTHDDGQAVEAPLSGVSSSSWQ